MSIRPDSKHATVDITIPVFNEEDVLAKTIASLTRFLEENLLNPWRVTIADNASTDNT